MRRKRISFPYVKHASKSYVFFGEDNDLLCVKWLPQGAHPGIYEISRHKLGRQMPYDSARVDWDDYEKYMVGWSLNYEVVASNKTDVFRLVWLHFIVGNEKTLAAEYDPLEVYGTLEGSDSVLRAVDFIEKFSEENSVLHSFWSSCCLDIMENYGYWLAGLKSELALASLV